MPSAATHTEKPRPIPVLFRSLAEEKKVKRAVKTSGMSCSEFLRIAAVNFAKLTPAQRIEMKLKYVEESAS